MEPHQEHPKDPPAQPIAKAWACGMDRSFPVYFSYHITHGLQRAADNDRWKEMDRLFFETLEKVADPEIETALEALHSFWHRQPRLIAEDFYRLAIQDLKTHRLPTWYYQDAE